VFLALWSLQVKLADASPPSVFTTIEQWLQTEVLAIRFVRVEVFFALRLSINPIHTLSP
jgi:hypothetical protein